MALDSTPSAAEWNTEFSTLATALNGVRTNEGGEFTGSKFRIAVRAAAITSSSHEKYRSVYFTAPMDMTLHQMTVGMIGLSGNTVKLELAPAIPDSASTYATESLNVALNQGDSDGFPSVSNTTSGTAVERAQAAFYGGDTITHRLRRGRRYKLVISVTSGSSQPWVAGGASFAIENKRI